MTEELLDGTATEDAGQDQGENQPDQPTGDKTQPAGQDAGAPDDAGTGDGDPQQPEDGQTEAKTFTQEDVDRLIEARLARERRKAERDALEDQQRRIAALEQRQAGGEKPAEGQGQDKAPNVPLTREKPTLQDHSWDQEKYLDDLADWKLEQAWAKRDAQERQRQEQQQQAKIREQQQQQITQLEAKRLDMFDAGAKKYPDFEAVATTSPIDPLTAELVLHCPKPAEVAYHLGKNHDLAQELNKMSPVERAIRIGSLAAAAGATPAQRPSNLPPPRKPSRGRVSATEPDMARLAKENPKKWRELRHQQLKKRAGG